MYLPRRNLKYLIALTVLVGFFAVFMLAKLQRSPEIGRSLSAASESISEKPGFVKIINPTEVISGNTSDISCTTATLQEIKFPICTFLFKEDRDISSPFLGGGYFDSGGVEVILKELKGNDRLEFVDLGANFGTYTLAVAKILHRHVLAVEANPETVKRLAKGIVLGNVTDVVTVIQNAIGQTHDDVEFARVSGRAGLNHVVSNGSRERFCSHGECIRVGSVMLDDLIPLVTSDSVVIKADIEESEPNVFRNISAGKFFNKFKVPMIMMEFEAYLRTEARKQSTVEWLDEFFYSRDYVPYNADTGKLMERDFSSWPFNIYWKKKN